MDEIVYPDAPGKPVTKWQTLYHAALHEKDQHRVSRRIADAENAITLRLKELFLMNADHIEEEQFLDDALYALRALRNCLGRPNAA